MGAAAHAAAAPFSLRFERGAPSLPGLTNGCPILCRRLTELALDTIVHRTRIRRIGVWLWYWLPPMLVMAVIFYFSSRSSLPQAKGEWLDALIKKLMHVGEYTLLFLLLVRAWRQSLPTERALWAALLTTAMYGVSDEVHQSFVPRRHANWYDVAIDVALPLLLCALWYVRRLWRTRDNDLAE